MSTWAELLYARLTSDATVAAFVGDRIYPSGITGAEQPPQYPYITYQDVGTDHMHVMNGAAGLKMPRVQLNCWMDKFDSERLGDLVEAVRLALLNYVDLAAGWQAAIPIGSADLPVENESRSVGRFIEFELHVAEATS